MKYRIKDSSVEKCKKEFCEILDRFSLLVKKADLNDEDQILDLCSKFSEEIPYIERSLIGILMKISEDELGYFEEVVE